MATQRMQGLEYFPLGVDFFQEQGVRALVAKYGTEGPAAYLFLLCETYRAGYVLSFDEETLWLYSAELKVSHESFLEILGFSVSRGMFDAGLYARGYLSSREIQRTWQEASRRRAERRAVLAERETWLLSAEETESYVSFRGDTMSADSKGEGAEDCGREKNLTVLTDEELRLLGQRLDEEAATPATEADIAEGGAFWAWAERKEAHSREVARRKESARGKWRGGNGGYLKSYEEVMDGWGLSPGVRQGVRALLRHCQINRQTYTNDRLDNLCARLLDLPDDVARAEALQTALDSGRFMIR